ncbi:hypothetical protein GOBAR_AA04561 [Gossypium barbadense]|uniref:Uncharacterized protein n=1 Tax=Gossypium barbadense TaxID=3634 RepID=A0A2P5YKF9_GOSBA|nr:hypothetical protein GOBAR_AA04561 [Gossypium barbadense]
MRKGGLTLRVRDETITLQARNMSNTSKLEGGCINHSTKTDHVVQPTLQDISSKNLHEPCSSNKKGPLTHDKPKPCHDDLNVAPNQLKVGDEVLLDAADPRIATSEPSGAIPLTVLNIFPYGTVEVIHSKFETFKENSTHLKPYVDKIDSRDEEFSSPHGRAHGRRHGRTIRLCENREKIFLSMRCDKWPRHCDVGVGKSVKPTRRCDTPVSRNRDIMSNRGKKTTVPASKKRKGPASYSGPTVEIRHPFPQFSLGSQEELFQILRARPLGVGLCIDWTALEQIQMADAFRLGGLVRQLSIPKFGIALGLYTEEFVNDNELDTLHRHIHYFPSKCWKELLPVSTTYDPSRSKASALSLSLRYLHAILAHTLTGHGTIILPYYHRPDVPTGHLKHATYEDDRETSWNLPSAIPPHLVHQGGGPREHY